MNSWKLVRLSLKKHSSTVTPPPTPYQVNQEKKRNREAYLNACRHLGIPHVSYIARKLSEPVIRARSHGFGPKEARAIAVALVVS